MQKHFRAESSPRWPRVMTERASTQEDHPERFTTQAKIKFNHKSLGRGMVMKQPVIEYQSQHYSRNHRSNKQSKPQFTDPKNHRNLSYSKKTSKKQNKPFNQEQNEDFLIRIPKNEDMIENYIQQLKQLKRKVFQQKQKEPQTIRNEFQNINNNDNVNMKSLQKSKQKLQFIKDSQNNDNKADEFLLKLPIKKEQIQQLVQKKEIGRMSSGEDKRVIKQIRKTEQVRGQRRSGNGIQQQKVMFCRDIKKHIKKLKMFKEYVDQNQHYNNDHEDINENENANEYTDFQYISGKRNLINYPQSQSNDTAIHQRSPYTSKFISPYISQPQSQRCISKQSTSTPLYYPKKVIYGNVINLKQQFMVQPICLETATNRRFHRYSSQLGVPKKLSMVSKSIDVRGGEEEKKTGRTRTEEASEKMDKAKSLVLRRKTEQHKKGKKQLNFHINNKFPLRQINLQNSTGNTPPQQKPQTQRSPTKQKSPSKLKNNTSPQKNSNPFKSIQGFSTIQQHKETLDILGQSCLQIKNNLIESHKKMDHILDLLEGNMIDLEGNGHKERKRKSSYERFSKAFPKDFFK